jgi:hypothetical protein
MRQLVVATTVTFCLVASAVPAGAQGYKLDARRIGMGGAGTHQDDAAQMTCQSRRYEVIGLPFGLIQVAQNTEIFDPTDPEFNPILAMEYLANPMAIVFHREMSDAGMQFVSDIVNSELNPNLNAYRGFSPVSNFAAQGIADPSWGATFKFRRRVYDEELPNRTAVPQYYQGIYVGSGPYFSLGSTMNIDPELIAIFNSPTPVFIPNTTFPIFGTTQFQGAAALTGGYRARFKVPRFFGYTRPATGVQRCGRSGIYVAANANYLQGIHYENIDLNVELDTNALGLVTLVPASAPVVINRLEADGGRGFSVDIATAIVVDRWSLSVAVRGIGNHINWRDLDTEQWRLNALSTGAEFIQSPRVRLPGTTRVELPTRYSAFGRYDTERWSADVDVFYGLNKFEFYGGAEYRREKLDFRWGARRSLDKWNPAAGLGINFTDRFGLDIAGFGTTTNLEETRKAAIAVSLRLEH